VSERSAPAAGLAAYFERVRRRGKSPGEEPSNGAAHGIQVRRFAGPQGYVGRLDPLRVAHLTDLHVGRVTPFAVQRAAVELTNAERPDLVVITGDFVCHSLLYLDQLAEVMRGFDAPVIGVLGNHDHWSGAKEVAAVLRRAGVLVLENGFTTIEHRGSKLQVVGVDDEYTGHANLEDAVKGLDPRLPSLGLSHIAEEADAMWQHDIPLVLSGHTHAGQVTLARMHEIAFGRLTGHRYIHGLYGSRKGEAQRGAVYVGAGIGASVVPLRLGERGQREIALFELGTSPGSFDEHHEEQTPLAGRAVSARKKAKRAAAVEERRAKNARRGGGES
jgi:hypothetical protein